MRRAIALFVLLALFPTVSFAAKDPAITARNIIPSGQLGAVPPPAGADRQALMYDALTPLFDNVTNADLRRDFKSEAFNSIGGDGPVKEVEMPRPGVRIVRDRYNVPHVTAKRYALGIWAAGWIAAEDRNLLLEQARYNARVAAIDAPGLSALGLIAGLKTFVPSPQTEAQVAKQAGVLRRAGLEGRRVLHDIELFCKGINAEYRKTGNTAKPWTSSDVFALDALKGQFVGQGGGDEARRTQFFASLQARLGPDVGLQVFNDLRQHDDPEQPTSIEGRFPYERIPSSRAGNVIIDPGSFVRTPAATLPPAMRSAPEPALASNELMVDAKHSTTHHPLLVGGPQIGYYYPGLTYEIDMNAPGLHWRGATTAPFPGYMLIGRGRDFAVTLTSAGADIIDQYAETLCGGSDTNYVYKGSCRAMGTFDAGVLKGSSGAPDQEVTFRTTVHGPVVGYATVNGTKVAISSKRSSYGRDALDLLLYRDMSTGAVHSPKTFFAAAAKSPQTFNSFYIDAHHIAEFTSGRLPLRPANVDPGLLTNGNGSFEWHGFLKASAHPHQADPRRGYIVNWNNNIAHGFGSSDEDWMRAGAVARVDLLNKNLKRLANNGKQSLATVTSAMNAAATQDVRAIDTVPLLGRLLSGSTAPSPRAQQMLDLMEAWSSSGGSRLDRDLDGKIDDPGAAIMDAAWPKIANAFMAPVLGPNLDELATLVRPFDHPSIPDHTGQFGGWYQYFDKDVRAVLGEPVKGAFATRFCGSGDKARCQADVWAAINSAGSDLATAQGTADPTAWRSDATAERIKFIPGLLPLTIRYTNRPTGIQQVISFR